MSQKNLLVLLVSVFALAAVSAQSASAFGQITGVEIAGVQVIGGSIDLANFAGDKVPIFVTFTADSGTGELAKDVRIKTWISGESQNSAVSDKFVVLAGKTYTKLVYLDVPADLNDELDETRSLEIVVESRTDTADEVSIDFTVQRESYIVEILSVDMQPQVNTGEPLVVDVVIKNRGRHTADDVFLDLTIPELGLETRTYFGDLTPTDQGGDEPEKDDAAERRAYLRIPANVEPGLYTVVLEASNDDSYDRVERRVLVVGGELENTLVVSASQSKTFNVGEAGKYTLTLVNRGNVVKVYELVAKSQENLNVDLKDNLVVVPAGSSRTVEIEAKSSIRDEYTFTVDVLTDSGTPVTQETFRANVVEGNGSTGFAANTTVLLTVILAIIFVVLLVVLIVLLTRKPETKEEFGESYY